MRVQVNTAAFGVDAVAVGTVAVDTTASARSMPEAGQRVCLAAGRRQEVRFAAIRGREALLAAGRGQELRDVRLDLDRGQDLRLRLGTNGAVAVASAAAVSRPFLAVAVTTAC
mgnify:CR=1 FL=1